MAAEPPAASELTYSPQIRWMQFVTDSIMSQSTRTQMLATLAGLSGRLVTELSGALHMHAVIEDEKTLLRCSGSLVETTMSVCLSGPPYSTPIVINRNLFMKSALGVSTTP